MLPGELQAMPDPQAVQSMFARIAGRYDLLNRTLSMGVDQRWRKHALAEAGELPGSLVVDLCCGTGDLSLLFARHGARVIGVDFTHEMVALAPAKKRAGDGPTAFLQGDALRLPLPDNCADAASVAFGIRNVADRRACMREMARIVRPGGRVLILEFTTPPGRIFGAIYRTYFTQILPRIGGLVSGDRSAYEYLPATVLAWPSPEELAAEMEAEGLQKAFFRRMTGGIACLHVGEVPGASSHGSGS
ncbi:MAG: demethylmenaquinone methyltransferase/2-methoxy-6-polyprenyl-1,4-benzoquinol methylase [Planctomycetota bacterium]|jgi:demethylmenaquinone methyltransferase/2-methoxy-6-polyprenyl-1,4-benzoquinol methylase